MMQNPGIGLDSISPQRPTAGGGSASGGGGDPASFFTGLDASSSKQLAALTAAGNARRATQAGPAGVTSGPFVGGMNQQSHNNYGHAASPLLGHHPVANSAPFAMAGQDQSMLLQQQRQQMPNMMGQPPSTQYNQNMMYKQRQQGFLRNLASIMLQRGTPLPPAISGFPVQTYDPNTSHWKHVEPASEVGGIKVAGQDVDLLKLWSAVNSYGGLAKFQQQNLWPNLVPLFNLPETLPQPMPDGSLSTAAALASHYMAIIAPFEEVAAANRPAAPGAPPPMGGQGVNQGRPSMPFAGQMQQSASQGTLQQQQQLSTPASMGEMPQFGGRVTPQTPQLRASGSMMNMLQTPLGTSPPTAPPQNKLTSELNSSTGLDFEIDADGRKRKVGESDDMDVDGKRTRRKTGDTDQPATPLRGEPMSSTNSHMPTTPTPANGTRRQPHRRKIEYVPLARDLEGSAGGRDVQLIHNELQQLITPTGRPFRGLDEWGRVHVEALTMSLRSRISTELSYALTTLDILSTLRTRQQPESGLSIAYCDDLLEELLDLLEESAFGGVDDDDVEIDVNTPIVTHRQLLSQAQDEMASPFGEAPPKRGPLASFQSGPVQRKGDIIRIVVNILRNFSSTPDNQTYLAQHPTLTDVLLRLTTLGHGNPGTAARPASSALSLLDIIVVRRDVISTLVNLAGAVSFNGSSSPSGDVKKARRLFELVASYVVDPTESQPPFSWIMQAGLPTNAQTRAPVLTDAALEVFTRASQPDSSRQVFAKAVPHEWMYSLFASLVHRLPLMDHDFLLAMRETPPMPEVGGTWHAYVEKVIMALYSLAFLMPPSLKKRVREDRPLSFSRVMFRFVRKCLSGGGLYSGPQAGQEMRNFFFISTRRAVECVKLIEDGADSFDTGSSGGGNGAPLLSFGVGYGEAGDKHVEKGTGLWGGKREDILWMLTREADEVTFAELESLARVDCDAI